MRTGFPCTHNSTRHMIIFFPLFFLDFLVLMLLSAHVKRFSVSDMQDFSHINLTWYNHRQEVFEPVCPLNLVARLI